jgi:cobalamin biosynthesis protein CobW
MAADLIVLNKTDLIDDSAGEQLKRDVASIVPRAVKIVAAQEGRVDAGILLGLSAAAEDDLANRPSHHDALGGEHEHDDFESFVVTVPEIREPDDLLARLRAVAEAHDVLRIKGFVPVAGKPMRLAVQGVGARFRSAFDRPWPDGEARRGHIVVIGERGLDRAAIEADILG